MPGAENFGEQFGMSKREEREIAGAAFGQHLLDSMAQASGYHDYEHQQLEKTRNTEDRFVETYRDRNIDHHVGRHPYGGEVVPDPTYEGNMYRIKHPSGWIAEHRGMLTTMVHPKKGPVDLIDWNDNTKHGMGSLATPDEWPTPAQVHAGVDEFVNDPANDY
jgi:hypothetical protein